MMQAPVNIIGARAVDFEQGLPDLTLTPWRRVWLSSREPIWTLVDAEDFDWLMQWQWNVWHGGRGKEWFSLRQAQHGRAARHGANASRVADPLRAAG